MKKFFSVIAFAMCISFVLTSCSSKNDRIIDKYEKIIDGIKKTDNVLKKQSLALEAAKVLEDLDTEKLTEEQETRLVELGLEFTKAYGDVVKDGVNFMNKATKSLNKLSGDEDSDEDSDEALDAFNSAIDGVNSLLGGNDDDND